MSTARRDGARTRDRLLRAASAVFSEKGYRDATVSEICSRAGANLASVNYYFRDKVSLYQEVWRRSAEREAAMYPMGGGVPPSAPAARRLEGIVGTLVKRMGDRENLGAFQRLKAMELEMPTGLVLEVVRTYREPLRNQLKTIIRELLGGRPTAALVERCERGIVAQCMVVRDALRTPFSSEPARPLSPSELESWTDHITRFSIAGLRALARTGHAEKSRRTK